MPSNQEKKFTFPVLIESGITAENPSHSEQLLGLNKINRRKPNLRLSTNVAELPTRTMIEKFFHDQANVGNVNACDSTAMQIVEFLLT